MKVVKVLVFPCGSEIGLEIHNALKFSSHVELFGASSVPDHGKFVYKNYVEGIPYVDNADFIPKLNTIIKRLEIDFIFPAHDDVIVKLAENLERIGCKVLTSPRETCKICRSKLKTYNFFQSILKVPRVYKINDKDIKYPVFLKPNASQGSRGVQIAESQKDLLFYLSKDPSLLILEYLPGKEYTIDCFTDRHGDLRFVGPRERVRVDRGISVNTKPVSDSRLKIMAEKINKRLKLRGVWFFQVKESKDKELALTEIAPRVAGSMGLYRNLGVNLPLLTIYDALDLDVEISRSDHLYEMDRALFNRFKPNIVFKHVYIDLDDTILLEEKINWFLIAFLYQCIGTGIKIHLISKHSQNIKKTLNKLRIADLFDSIIHVTKTKEKSDYIKEKSAIFIDDSFSERSKVSQALKIPSFDLAAVEGLIDWRS